MKESNLPMAMTNEHDALTAPGSVACFGRRKCGRFLRALQRALCRWLSSPRFVAPDGAWPDSTVIGLSLILVRLQIGAGASGALKLWYDAIRPF